MDAVRHSLGFAEDSDARVAQIVGAVCSMAGTALDRRLQNADAAPRGWGSVEGSGRRRALGLVWTTALPGCAARVVLKPLGVCEADGIRRCPRRQGESVFSTNSAELVLKTPCASGKLIATE